jgi:hypothetical protein
MKPYSDFVNLVKEGKPLVYLIEVSGVLNGDGTSLPSPIYISNVPYTTKPTDTPSNLTYLPILAGGLQFSASIDLDGGASIGYGDIELHNIGGERDFWLNYIWTNRDIDFYVGTLEWNRVDYYKLFSGTVVDISSRSNNSLNLVIADRLQKLNVPISETEITSSVSKDNTLIPVTLGECFNVSPITTNSVPNSLEYQVNISTINGIIEVRDNGAQVNYTPNLPAGKFTLNQAPYGQITCSVKGHATVPLGYTNKVGGLIRRIITDPLFGTSTSQVTLSAQEIDDFGTFDTLYPDPVGIYCSNRENILDVCNELASSIGAQLTATSLGRFKLVLLDTPQAVLATNIFGNHVINESDILDNSLAISEKPVVSGTKKVGFCKNWTVQSSGLALGLPSGSVALFDSEWLYETATNATTITRYKLDEQPVEIPTMLLTRETASNRATKLLNLMGVPRFIYTFQCFADKLNIELGDTLTLTHSRFDLQAGKLGLVVSLEKDWVAGRVTIGVLV